MAKQNNEDIDIDLNKPINFREYVLIKLTRLDEEMRNHVSKHKYQVLIECGILVGIIIKIFI